MGPIDRLSHAARRWSALLVLVALASCGQCKSHEPQGLLGGGFGNRQLGGPDEWIVRSQSAFTLAGLAGAKPGQIPLINAAGAQIFGSNAPAPWGAYELFENGGAGSTSQGIHEYFNSPAGAGAQRTTLQGEPGWFQNAGFIETGTTTTGSMAINSAGTNSTYASAGNGTIYHESTFSVPTASDGTNRFAASWGCQDNTSAFVFNNGATIRYRDDNNGGRFEAVTAAAGTRSTTDTGITLVAGNYYRPRVEIVGGVARFWLKTIWNGSTYTDDGIWGNPQWTISTNVPSGTGQGFTCGSFIIKSLGTTSRGMKVGFNKGGRAPAFAGNRLATGPEGYTITTDENGAPGFNTAPHQIPASIVFYAFDRGGYTPSGSGIDFGSDFAGGGTQVLASAISDGFLGSTGLFTGSSATGYSYRRTAFNENIDSTVDPMVIEGLWQTPTLSNGTQTFREQFGLIDATASASTNNITFELDSNTNTHMLCVAQSGGVATTVDSGITITAATYYFARIVIKSTGIDYYLGSDGGGALTKVCTISTNIPTGTKNMAAALGVRKSLGTTSLSVKYSYLFAYQRSTTWTAGATTNAMHLNVAAHPSLSRSTTNGPYAPGEEVAILDDNSGTGNTPVLTFAPWNPRTHNFALEQTAHMNLWGSSDLNALGSETTSDLTHPNLWTYGCSASPGHVAVGNAGGVAIIVLSASRPKITIDAIFEEPTLSNGTTTFNDRMGLASATFGLGGSTPAHGIYAEIDSNTNTHMQFVTRAASVETRVDSGITITAGTYYRLREVITNNTQADFYLAPEGTPLPNSPTATITTNIPTGTGQALIPNFVIECTANATNANAGVIYQISMDRYAP